MAHNEATHEKAYQNMRTEEGEKSIENPYQSVIHANGDGDDEAGAACQRVQYPECRVEAKYKPKASKKKTSEKIPLIALLIVIIVIFLGLNVGAFIMIGQLQSKLDNGISSTMREMEIVKGKVNESFEAQGQAMQREIQLIKENTANLNTSMEVNGQNIIGLNKSLDVQEQKIRQEIQLIKENTANLNTSMEVNGQNIIGLNKSLDVQEQKIRQEIQLIKENTANLNTSMEVNGQNIIGLNKSLDVQEQKIRQVMFPEGCSLVTKEFARVRNTTGGVFSVNPLAIGSMVDVYCDLETDGGGWTVFQRRTDGSVSFLRDWMNYVNGFGRPDKEFWMGLEKLHRLTSVGNFELRVELEDWEGNTSFAKYTTFSVGDATSQYRITVGGYSGTAGDSLTYHNGRLFTVPTGSTHTSACSTKNKGAWWYGSCYHSNLNALYKVGGKFSSESADGISWYYWKNTLWYSMKRTEMKFRHKN